MSVRTCAVTPRRRRTRSRWPQGWLADERRLIESDSWSPPTTRDAERKAKAVTLADYSATWLQHRHIKERTRVHYQALLDQHINPTLGSVPLGHLTRPGGAQLVRDHARRQADLPHPRLRPAARDLCDGGQRRPIAGEPVHDRPGDEHAPQAGAGNSVSARTRQARRRHRTGTVQGPGALERLVRPTLGRGNRVAARRHRAGLRSRLCVARRRSPRRVPHRHTQVRQGS